MSVPDVPQKIQDVYKKWENKSVPRINARYNCENHNYNNNFQERRRPRSSYYNRGNRSGTAPFDRRNKRFQRHSTYRSPRNETLASFKMSSSVEPAISSRPFIGLCCTKCVPQSRATIPNSYIHSLCVCNLFMLPFEEKSVIPVTLRPLYYIMCRYPKFQYPDVSAKVLHSRNIHKAIEADHEDIGSCVSDCSEKETGTQHLKEQMNKVTTILQNLKASLSPLLLRLSALALYQVLPGIFRSIYVHRGQIEMLKAASDSSESSPIIYIPLNKGDLDYFLVPFILYMNDLKVPLTAVDDDSKIGICLRKILQYLGAFFVKPKLKTKSVTMHDRAYRAVLQSFIVENLKAGHSLKIMNNSRQCNSHKHLSSSNTVLHNLIDVVLRDEVDDVQIVPVSMSYEKIADGNFVSEQLGKFRMQNRFILFWKGLFTFLSTVRVDFCQPFSLKEFLSSNDFNVVPKNSLPSLETPPSSLDSDNSNCSEAFHSNPEIDNLRFAVKCLMDHVTYDATFSTALMSTQLLSFLFLTKHRQGATQPQLVCSFNILREELSRKKRNVGFLGESADVVKYAINLLGKELICTEAIELEWTNSDMENNNMKFLFHKPVVKLPHVIELHYYSSFVVPSFVIDSVIANALYAVLDGEICHFQLCESKLFVSRQELIEKAAELCGLLQFEFVCIPPCANLESAFNDVIDELTAKECLQITKGISYTGGRMLKVSTRKSNLSFGMSDDEDDYISDVQQHLKVDLRKESIDHLEFLRCILSPYIESYWLTACTLLKLLDEVVEEKEFIRRIQRTAEDRLGKGLLGYEESFGTRTLRNALKLFKSKHIVEYYFEGDLKMLYLSESYDSDEKLSDLILWIEEFRK